MWKAVALLCVVFSATLYSETKMLAFAGSTRENSTNKKLIVEAVYLARQMGINATLIDLKDYPLPFYEEDLEAKQGMPPMAKQFRRQMIQSDAILIASPDYNASISAVLKNALDWASRTEAGGRSREAFKGKKFGLVAATGSSGNAHGLSHLRAILEEAGGTVSPLQVVVPSAYNAFDEKGHLKNDKIKIELQKLIQAITE